MIETVIFDLGNVLVDVRTDTLQRQLAARLDLSREDLQARLMGMLPLMEAYERGRLNGVAFYQQVLNHFDLTPAAYPFAEYREHWCGALVASPPMEALFEEVLGTRGVRVCVLSNTNDLHWMYAAERFPLVQHAWATLVSYECGLYKPEAAIYHLALERFEIKNPATALFIDDRPENVEAAINMGLESSFIHKSPEDTRSMLTHHKVLSDRV